MVKRIYRPSGDTAGKVMLFPVSVEVRIVSTSPQLLSSALKGILNRSYFSLIIFERSSFIFGAHMKYRNFPSGDQAGRFSLPWVDILGEVVIWSFLISNNIRSDVVSH